MPGVTVEKVIVGALTLPQNVAFVTVETMGVGLTVMENEVAGPVQVAVLGVIENELTIGFVPALVAL